MNRIADIDVSYYLNWNQVSDDDIPVWVERFSLAGAKKLVFGTNLLFRSITSPLFLKMLTAELERHHLTLEGSHAPFSQAGLNMAESPEKEKVLKERKEMISLCGDLGVKVLVNHMSSREEFCDLNATTETLRVRCLRALDELLPCAEKAGITLALENIFFPADRPDELLAIVNHFNSPFLGVCYDFGHANIVEERPGCSSQNWPESRKKIWGSQPVIWEKNMLERLLPHVVCLHMHDNSGIEDEHAMPGEGNVNWKKLLPLLEKAPRLLSSQTEVSVIGKNITPEQLCATFRNLGFRS